MASSDTGTSSLSKFTVPLAGTDTQGSSGTLMPKLKYRFRVSFESFGIGSASELSALTKNVSEAARPNLKFENKVIDVYNSKINYAAKPTWEAINIKFRDDNTGSVTKLIGQQNQKQFDFYEQSSAAAAGDYKFKMTIEMLDGGNGAHTATVLETWTCFGCYIETTNYNQLTYADGAYVTIDLTIRPDNCVQQANTAGDIPKGNWLGTKSSGFANVGG